MNCAATPLPVAEVDPRSGIVSVFRRIHGRPPAVVARAPGRIEFIGNHTDYNGGPVLGASIDRGIRVAIAPRPDGRRRFHSGFLPSVELEPGADTPLVGEQSWVNYPLGVLFAMAAHGFHAPAGFDCAVLSDLPPGAGLSSSAALELAFALAFLELAGQSAKRETLVAIGKHAENHFVGVPCGILDQGVIGFGRRHHLVHIDCSAPIYETVPLPRGSCFWIFNTHTKHALVDGLYAARHAECMSAAKTLGVTALARVSPAELDARKNDLAPDDFKRARHVVTEIGRVRAAVSALHNGDLRAVGALLTASHHSSRDDFENSTPELDHLVDRLASSRGVHGARLTGGGFGGAVMALAGPEFGQDEACLVADSYSTRFGCCPDIQRMETADGAELVSLSD